MREPSPLEDRSRNKQCGGSAAAQPH